MMTENEHEMIIRMCSQVAYDPSKMYVAILNLLDMVEPRDAEWLKEKLGVKEKEEK